MAGDVTRGVDHLANAESVAVAEVADEFLSGFETMQGQKMSFRKIENVDVIANTGSVRSGVVGTKDGNVGALSGGSLQDERNQVRLRMVGFAEFDGRAGGIEVAKAGVAKTVDLMEPREHALDEEL